MTSKVEYLQRYLSSTSGDDVDGKKKKKRKKVRHIKDATRGTHVVGADDAWELSASQREKIEMKWELDAAEDELPLVVAVDGGEDPVDAQDLPVYVNSDKYLDDYQGKKKAEKLVDDGDLSPPRKRGGEGRRGSGESDDEALPMRKSTKEAGVSSRYRSSGDDSKRSGLKSEALRGESVEDESPRTKVRSEQSSKSKEDVEGASPSRQPTRVEQDEDASPPRRRRRFSTLLWRSRDDDEKEKGRKQYNRDDEGESKAEFSRTRNSSVEKTTKNASLPKKSTAIITSPTLDDAESVSHKIAGHSNEKRDAQVKTLDEKEVKRAGLFTAADFERQREIAAKLKDRLLNADASEMGANAETVYRDKRGRKLDMLNEIVRQQEVLDGKRKREEREEYEWGTGEVQKRERKSKQELIEQMKNTPFARHEDDEELERKRRGRVRAFDPMHSKIFLENSLDMHTAAKAKKRKRGTKKATKAKPKYAGPPAPPNRFGIVPGYRWDGVVRGTNWEEKIMMRQNANAAGSEEAYRYAVADM